MAFNFIKGLAPGRGATGAPQRKALARAVGLLATPPVVGVIGLGCYSIAVSSLTALATGLLLAAAALVAGGVLGFLFALPRSSGVTTAPGQTQGPLRSSTSLEEIADWLTKILVGLGLVELGKLVTEAERLINFLGPALGPAETSRRAVALAILSLFTLSGFLLSYLGTRISLAVEFAHAEEQLRTREADVEAATSQLQNFVMTPQPSAGEQPSRGNEELSMDSTDETDAQDRTGQPVAEDGKRDDEP